MQKKNIAFFTSSFNVGGVERAFVNLANELVSQGHNVDFVVSLGEGILKDELHPDVKIINFSGVRLRGSFVALYKYLKKTDLDAVFSGPTYPNIILVLCSLFIFKKTKIIISQHSYLDLEVKNIGLAGKIMPFLMRRTYHLADKVVAVSDGVKEDLIKNFNVKPVNVVKIYNAVIDDSFYEKANAPVEQVLLKKISQKPYLIAIGRMESVKNYSFMVDAFCKILTINPDFGYNLVIVGNGSEFKMINQRIQDLDLSKRIFLIGSRQNPYNVLKASTLLIHTSFSETMGLNYVEALALHIPIVTVANKGANEILKNVKTKSIVSQHDLDDFIVNLHIVLGKKFLNSDFPDISNFTSKVIANQFLALL